MKVHPPLFVPCLAKVFVQVRFQLVCHQISPVADGVCGELTWAFPSHPVLERLPFSLLAGLVVGFPNLRKSQNIRKK